MSVNARFSHRIYFGDAVQLTRARTWSTNRRTSDWRYIAKQNKKEERKARATLVRNVLSASYAATPGFDGQLGRDVS